MRLAPQNEVKMSQAWLPDWILLLPPAPVDYRGRPVCWACAELADAERRRVTVLVPVRGRLLRCPRCGAYAVETATTTIERWAKRLDAPTSRIRKRKRARR